MRLKTIKVLSLFTLIGLISSCSLLPTNSSSDDFTSSSSDTLSSDSTSSKVPTSDDINSSSDSQVNESTSSKGDESSSSSSSSISEEIPSDENYYKLTSKVFNTHDVSVASGISSTPTKGNVNILVVPVEFSDLTKFTRNDLTTMNIAFNGDKSDNSNSYWESVKSFYYKSSFGKLNLSFTFTDVFTPSIKSTTFKSYEKQSDGKGTFNILTSIYKSATINKKSINYDDYDIDNDGSVDGIWLIYNEKDTEEGDSYWPYVYWYNYSDDYDYSSTKTQFSNFANCAMSFLYEGNSKGYDAHTLIHETGHLLGLDDYYTYDYDDLGVYYDSLGGYDMQNLNIGDHGGYSKTIMDWIDPYVVTGDTTIKINSYSTTGDTIIIPANLNNFNRSGFNEYIMLELYTPEGLYYKDAYTNYSDRPTFYQNTGVRMYYIDSRIAELKTNRNDEITGLNYIKGNTTSLTYPSVVTHSNSLVTSYEYDVNKTDDEFLYSTIAKGVNHNFYDYAIAYDTKTNKAIESYLFYKGDEFSLSKYNKLFSNNKYFHDGSSVNFSITIDDISNKQATISVKYN